MSSEIIIDQYSALSHKAGLDGSTGFDLVPTWIPKDSRRRLNAYRILDAYLGNVARHLIQIQDGPGKANEIREFGDARVLCNRIVAGVVGTEPALHLVDAINPPPTSPMLPDAPPDASDLDSPTLAVVRARQAEIYEQTVADLVDDWSTTWEAWPRIRRLNEWLEAWQVKVRYAAKVHEMESTSVVPLGDGVAVMGVEDGNPYPTLTIYEPDAYHPVLDPSNNDDYPTKVHLAWEFIDDDDHRRLRRITYQLVDLDVPRPSPWGDPRTQTCLMSDLTWDLAKPGRNGWVNLDDDSGVAEIVTVDGVDVPVIDLDLGIDWLPVLHIPNTPATQAHFGRSSLTNVAQLFDSISAVDTDIERAAAIAGLPILGIESDIPPIDVKLKPGLMLNGKVTAVDLSAALSALRALQQDLLDRLAVNSEVPGPVMGRVDANVIPSGVALALLHAPFETLVQVLRLTRSSKYPMLGKWAMRWAQLRGDLDVEGVTPTVEATFPSTEIRDVTAIVAWVVAAIDGGTMSRATGVRVLQDAGIPIEDVEEELARIVRDDIEGAVKIADATGSEAAAAARLGIDLDAFIVEPAVRLAPDETPRV